MTATAILKDYANSKWLQLSACPQEEDGSHTVWGQSGDGGFLLFYVNQKAESEVLIL